MARLLPLLPLLVAMLATGPVRAQEAQTRGAIDRIQQNIAKTRADEKDAREREKLLAAELTGLRADMVAAARAVQEREREAGAVEDELKRLEGELRTARDGLRSRQTQLGATLGALQRIALRPAEAALVSTESPLDMMRGGVLLQAALDPLERDAAAFRGDIDVIGRLRNDVNRQQIKLETALSDMRRDRTRLAGLVTRKEELRRRAAGEGRTLASRIEGLGEEERALRDLLARLESERKAAAEAQQAAEAERRARAAQEAAAAAEARAAAARAAAASRSAVTAMPAPAPAPVALARVGVGLPSIGRAAAPPAGRGAYLYPAQGKLVQRFGEGTGLTGRGLLLDVRAGAQVVAPHDGKVVYAGPFRGYGVLLIIEHSDGYHTLLSGMTSLEADAGQWVLAGEPVGTIAAVDGAVPNLYVELRHNGQPVDPLVRLAARNG